MSLVVHTQTDVGTGATRTCIVKHQGIGPVWSRSADLPDLVLVLEPEPHWEPVVEGIELPATYYENDVTFITHPDRRVAW